MLPVLSGTIDWEVIEQQYDEMVKYAAALHRGTAEPKTILCRFVGAIVMHPTYTAIERFIMLKLSRLKEGVGGPRSGS